MPEHMEASDRSVTVIAMIEDVAGVEARESILAVEGIDGILIGRADLTVAMGESAANAPRVVEAVNKVLDACRAVRKPALLYVGTVSEAEAVYRAFRQRVPSQFRPELAALFRAQPAGSIQRDACPFRQRVVRRRYLPARFLKVLTGGQVDSRRRAPGRS